MPRSINDFKSSFKDDLARPSRFDVNIPIPLTLIPYVSTARNLTYRCESTNLPGRQLATMEQKSYGPVESYPYATTFNDIDMTFLVDADMNQKLFFDAWLQYINPLHNNNYRYKGDYSTTLRINQYDQANELTYSVDLYEAFPVSTNQMDLDWSSDGVHKLVVTFNYTYWKNNSLQALGMELVDAGLESAVTSIGGLGGTGVGVINDALSVVPKDISLNFNK
jgi:hypothetical protein